FAPRIAERPLKKISGFKGDFASKRAGFERTGEGKQFRDGQYHMRAGPGAVSAIPLLPVIGGFANSGAKCSLLPVGHARSEILQSSRHHKEGGGWGLSGNRGSVSALAEGLKQMRVW